MGITVQKTVSALIEYLESIDHSEIVKVIASLPEAGNRKRYTLEQMRKDTE